MTTQITITAPVETDKTVLLVDVEQFQNAGEGSLGWVSVKKTVVLHPGESMNEYIHRTQRVVITDAEWIPPVSSAVDAADQSAAESKVQNADGPAPGDLDAADVHAEASS